MNQNKLSRLKLHGFKSIQECDLELTALNVLIGANGAGKSNLIGFFQLVQQLLTGRLQRYASKHGGPDSLLHSGRKHTEQLSAEIYFGHNCYKFILKPTQDNRLVFASETLSCDNGEDWQSESGHFESKVELQDAGSSIYDVTVPFMKNWRVYHFNDTDDTAPLRQWHGINDNLYLRPDARNLAAFLAHLRDQHPRHYNRIVKTVRLVAPFFGGFLLRPRPNNENQIELEWTEEGEDTPCKAHLLSDGTLRFICLATILIQPEELQPETILIDEPELGLHPFAIAVLASLLHSTSKRCQIIASTQSTDLLNEFSPEHVIVADRKDGATHLQRLNAKALETWLSDHSLGELWEKNVLGGRPAR